MGRLRVAGELTKKEFRLEEASEDIWKLHDYSDKVDFIELDKVNSRINLPSLPLYLAGKKGLEYDAGADRFNTAKDIYSEAIAASLGSHASRHNRGGDDAINWAALSKYLNKSASGVDIGASGSPASILKVEVESNYYNLLPLQIDVSPSGLGTDESVTYHIILHLDDGSTQEVATVSGVTAATTIKLNDLDLSGLGDGRQIRAIEVTAESSATSTTATSDARIVALEM